MEVVMIEGRLYSRLIQSINDLLEKTKKLNPKPANGEWYTNKNVSQLQEVSLRTLQTHR